MAFQDPNPWDSFWERLVRKSPWLIVASVCAGIPVAEAPHGTIWSCRRCRGVDDWCLGMRVMPWPKHHHNSSFNLLEPRFCSQVGGFFLAWIRASIIFNPYFGGTEKLKCGVLGVPGARRHSKFFLVNILTFCNRWDLDTKQDEKHGKTKWDGLHSNMTSRKRILALKKLCLRHFSHMFPQFSHFFPFVQGVPCFFPHFSIISLWVSPPFPWLRQVAMELIRAFDQEQCGEDFSASPEAEAGAAMWKMTVIHRAYISYVSIYPLVMSK